MGDEINLGLILHRLDEMKRVSDELNKSVSEINTKLNKINEIEIVVHELNKWKEKLEDTISIAELKELKAWKAKIDEVVSPSQMKELKDEVYKQKNKWTATIAILSFIQILMGVLVTLAKLGIF